MGKKRYDTNHFCCSLEHMSTIGPTGTSYVCSVLFLAARSDELQNPNYGQSAIIAAESFFIIPNMYVSM